MKTLTKIAAFAVLLFVAFIAGSRSDSPPHLPGADKVRILWQDDLATIDWTEELADPAAGADECPFAVLTGPYLGSLTDRSAVIGWEVVAARRLTESPYASLSANFDMKKMGFRSALLTDLKPDTMYRYRLTSGRGKNAYLGKEYRFRTLPAVGSKKLRFAVIGDTQKFADQPYTDINKRLYADINQWNPPLVLHVGDVVYTGWGEGINGRKNWYRVFNLMRDLRATRWLAPAMGNHDVQVGKFNWAPEYFRDLPGPANDVGPAQPPFYYSFDVGNVHFTVLSTEQRRNAEGKAFDRFTWKDQLAWLEEDLRRSEAPWKMVCFHQPLHTAGGYACSPEFREDFGPIFDKYNVAVLFSGHDHSYQRSLRIVNQTREISDTGAVQVISGGASNQFERSKRTLPWSVLHVKLYHYLRVEIDDDVMRVSCITDAGDVYESWSMKRTGQPQLVSK